MVQPEAASGNILRSSITAISPSYNPLPLIINPPHPPNNKYSQYIIVYHINAITLREVFIICPVSECWKSCQEQLIALRMSGEEQVHWSHHDHRVWPVDANLGIPKFGILLLEQILHHLKSLKSQFRAPRWCKISSINSTIWGFAS